MHAHVFAAGGQPTDLKVLETMFVCEGFAKQYLL